MIINMVMMSCYFDVFYSRYRYIHRPEFCSVMLCDPVVFMLILVVVKHG